MWENREFMKHSERNKQITQNWKTIRIITDIVLDRWKPKDNEIYSEHDTT